MKRQAAGWKQISAKDKKYLEYIKTLRLNSCLKKSMSKVGKRYEETFPGRTYR